MGKPSNHGHDCACTLCEMHRLREENARLRDALDKCDRGYSSLFWGLDPRDDDPDWQDARKAVDAIRAVMPRKGVK